MPLETNKQTIWIVRHGMRQDFIDPLWRESAENRHNSPLAQMGEIQAGETAVRMKSEKINHIFASPFLRTAQTANSIAAMTGKKVKLEAGFAELLTKVEKGRKTFWDDAALPAHRFPHIDRDYKSLVQPRYPENAIEHNNRVAETLNRIEGMYGGNILIVSHGSPINSIFKCLVNYNIKGYVPMCSLSSLKKIEGQWDIQHIGDSSHLSEPDTTGAVFYEEQWGVSSSENSEDSV